ncbi:hypothetical protein BDC45DRAFT_529528 [Circinella umbellata]|nr:hypothetical protein BDC45DRAFT_529528 [Circinella umbellata]
MDGGEIFGWIWFALCASPFAGVALYFIFMGLPLLLKLIYKGLYKIRVFHLIYYLTPNEFKYDPEQPLGNQNLSDAFLCSCCNSSLLLYQSCRGFNRIIIDKFRNLFHCLCGCIIRRRERRQTRNNDLELPIAHPLPQELLSKDNYNMSDTTIEEKQKYNEEDSKISPPEPAVFLTNPPRVTPMSTTTNLNTESSSSSSNTAV